MLPPKFEGGFLNYMDKKLKVEKLKMWRENLKKISEAGDEH